MLKLKKLCYIIILITIIFVNITFSNATENIEKVDNNIYVAYNSHVQDLGWEGDFSKINGVQSGTTGKNKKVEAVKIKLLNAPENVGITYQSYLNGIGWQELKSDGEISGTTGQNRKMEGIKIELIGTEDYSVEYRAHVQDIGWMEWKNDGEIAGVIGQNVKIEAIEIRIIPKKVTIQYKSHVQDIGWEQYFYDGDLSGKIGQGLKIEAMEIELKNAKGVKVEYQTHIQDIGWESEWKRNGEQSGTTGQNKKIEAIKIRLDDTNEIEKYSIQYRVFIQSEGWQDWKTDGEIAGTTGKNLRLEGIEIRIVDKVDNGEFSVRYTTHVQDIGWMGYKNQPEISGTTGQLKKIEAIKIIGKNVPEGVKIKYKSHVQDIGWEDWVEEGEQSGTTGQNLKIEAIRIKLEGTDEYSIQYRAHVQDIGWQDWANDGEEVGTTGQNKRIEAIEIKIVPKIPDKSRIEIDTIPSANIERQQLTIKGWLMTTVKDTKIQVKVNNEIVDANIKRVERKDVLQSVKGYGGEANNPTPGYEATIDFTNSAYENKIIQIQCVDKNGNVIVERAVATRVRKSIEFYEGVYGSSGLKIAGRGGYDLRYMKFGSGENVFFGTFAIHGFEDLWAHDGEELVDIANQFYNKLRNEKDYDLAEKWTIYLFPGVNQDGLKQGDTNNGPGRTTLYSQAPGNKGIDLNRCWQVGDYYQRYDDDRNYNGTTGFQAYEAQALRDFMLTHKSQNGQTILVDLHGWTQQLIGDPGICSYYEKQFPENNKNSVGRYGTGYMINWARTYLGSNGKPAKSALIELPKQNVVNHQSVVDQNFANRYIDATLDMLRNII